MLNLCRRTAQLMGIALLTSAFLPSAHGQAPSDEVVVTGKIRAMASRLERARIYLKQVGVFQNRQQLARWTDPVCVHVVGLQGQNQSYVTDEVRAIAENAGVPLADRSCKPNLLINFTNDAVDLMKIVRARSSYVLSEVNSNEKADLLTGSKCIRWWYNTETRGNDDTALTQGPAVAAPTGGNGGASLIPDKPSTNSYFSSLITTKSIRKLVRASIIIDAERCSGLTLRTVAQYAAMVGLAEIHVQFPPSESILDVFETGKVSASITKEDRAFLSILYKTALDRAAVQQKGAMEVSIAHTMSQ